MNEEPKGRVEIILPGEETDASRIWVATGAGRVKVVKLSPWQSLIVTAALLLLAVHRVHAAVRRISGVAGHRRCGGRLRLSRRTARAEAASLGALAAFRGWLALLLRTRCLS